MANYLIEFTDAIPHTGPSEVFWCGVQYTGWVNVIWREDSTYIMSYPASVVLSVRTPRNPANDLLEYLTASGGVELPEAEGEEGNGGIVDVELPEAPVEAPPEE